MFLTFRKRPLHIIAFLGSTRQFNIMMQRTTNENAACLCRISNRSDQAKIERIANNDARLIDTTQKA